jgi:predicted RecA/RadA family phage recombinase
MPKTTPNRVADPARLENYEPLAIVVQDGGLYLTFTNTLSTSILAGEFILLNNRVCVVRRTVLPGENGVAITDWIADVRVDDDLAAVINVNDVVYLDYDKTTITAGVGSATNVSPTNGYIIGRAMITPGFSSVASGEAIAATTSQKRVRVSALSTAVTIIGTVPTFSNGYA